MAEVGGVTFGLVVVVDLSGVTVAVAGEVDQEHEGDQEHKGEDKESDSPGLVVNQETDEGDDGDDDAQNEKSSEVPEGESGLEGGDVFVAETNAGVVDDSEAEDQEEGASQEDQVRHGLVVPLQASESGSGSEEEEEEEKSGDAALHDKVNSEEIDGAFEGGFFAETVVPGLGGALGSSGKVQRVLVLNVQVGQEEQGEASKDETEDEDGLGQVITRSGLEDIVVGFVAAGASGSPDDDGDGGDQEQSSGGDEEDDESRVVSAGVDAGENQGDDGEDNGEVAQVSGPFDVVTTLLAVEEIVFFKVFGLFIMGEALVEVIAASGQTVLVTSRDGGGGDDDVALNGSADSNVAVSVLHI